MGPSAAPLAGPESTAVAGGDGQMVLADLDPTFGSGGIADLDAADE